MKYKTQYTHNLISPVDYATGGETVSAKSIVVYAPGNMQRAAVSALEQEQAKALFKAAAALRSVERPEIPRTENTEVSEDPTDAEAESHLQFLAGNGFDLAAGYAQLKTLLAFQRNPARMDGKEKMTEDIFECLNLNDVRVLLGKYLLSFLVFAQSR